MDEVGIFTLLEPIGMPSFTLSFLFLAQREKEGGSRELSYRSRSLHCFLLILPTLRVMDDSLSFYQQSIIHNKDHGNNMYMHRMRTHDAVASGRKRRRLLLLLCFSFSTIFLSFCCCFLFTAGSEGIEQLRWNENMTRTVDGKEQQYSRRRTLSVRCTARDVSIEQSRDSSSAGIPRFSVQIVNSCTSNCAPSNIHVTCGWFASNLVVNPNVFRRLAFNDCLVNGGQPLPRGRILHFSYQNSFMYQISFKWALFC